LKLKLTVSWSRILLMFDSAFYLVSLSTHLLKKGSLLTCGTTVFEALCKSVVELYFESGGHFYWFDYNIIIKMDTKELGFQDYRQSLQFLF